jgi:FKBP-type peptidyl-prolyl cis-trans isomerase
MTYRAPLLLAALLLGCAAEAAPVVAPAPAPAGTAVVTAPTSTSTSTSTSTPTSTPTPTAAAPATAPDAPPSTPPSASGRRPDGLDVTVLIPGSGPGAQTGDHVRVHYVGTLLDGSLFDSSRSKGRSPFTFVLGKGTVIKGWEEGVLGMQVGEVRRLVIPSDLAYGDRGRPPVIPARSSLVFEIEMLAINPR